MSCGEKHELLSRSVLKQLFWDDGTKTAGSCEDTAALPLQCGNAGYAEIIQVTDQTSKNTTRDQLGPNFPFHLMLVKTQTEEKPMFVWEGLHASNTLREVILSHFVYS